MSTNKYILISLSIYLMFIIISVVVINNFVTYRYKNVTQYSDPYFSPSIYEHDYSLKKDTCSIKFHLNETKKFLSIPKLQKLKHRNLSREDRGLINYYEKLMTKTSYSSQVANVCLTYYYITENNYGESIEHLLKIEDNKEKESKVVLDLFTLFFKTESSKKDLSEVQLALKSIGTYLKDKKIDSTDKFILNTYLSCCFKYNFPIDEELSSSICIELMNEKNHLDYLKQKDYQQFIKAKFLQVISSNSFLPSILLAIIWGLFFIKINIFSHVKWVQLSLVVILSILSITLVYPLIYQYFSTFFLHQESTVPWLFFWSDCFLGIGVGEELTKILPVIFVLVFFRKNEPIDIIIASAFSALVFACIENMGKIETYSCLAINDRGLVCIFGHMFFSITSAYFFIWSKYKKKKNILLWTITGFLIAALLHGFYDYWVLARYGMLVSMFVMVPCMMIMASYISNTLNIDRHFDYKKIKKVRYLLVYLLILFSTIQCIEYGYICHEFGATQAKIHFFNDSVYVVFFITLLSYNLSNLDLRKEDWAMVNFYSLRYKTLLYQYINRKAMINADNSKITGVNNIKGEITHRKNYKYNSEYFQLKLTEPLTIKNIIIHDLFVNLKESRSIYKYEKENTVFLFIEDSANKKVFKLKKLSNHTFKFLIHEQKNT